MLLLIAPNDGVTDVEAAGLPKTNRFDAVAVLVDVVVLAKETVVVGVAFNLLPNADEPKDEVANGEELVVDWLPKPNPKDFSLSVLDSSEGFAPNADIFLGSGALEVVDTSDFCVVVLVDPVVEGVKAKGVFSGALTGLAWNPPNLAKTLGLPVAFSAAFVSFVSSGALCSGVAFVGAPNLKLLIDAFEFGLVSSFGAAETGLAPNVNVAGEASFLTASVVAAGLLPNVKLVVGLGASEGAFVSEAVCGVDESVTSFGGVAIGFKPKVIEAARTGFESVPLVAAVVVVDSVFEVEATLALLTSAFIASSPCLPKPKVNLEAWLPNENDGALSLTVPGFD